MAKYQLDFFDRNKGGSSASPAKQAASRRNGKAGGRYGKLGGRPVGSIKRTLAEFILRRKVATAEYPEVQLAFLEVFAPPPDAAMKLRGRMRRRALAEHNLEFFSGAKAPRYQFQRLFGISKNFDWKATTYNQHGRPSEKQQQLLRDFRKAFKRRIKKFGAAVVQAAAPDSAME